MGHSCVCTDINFKISHVKGFKDLVKKPTLDTIISQASHRAQQIKNHNDFKVEQTR